MPTNRRDLLMAGVGVLAAKATVFAVACASDPPADPHAGHAGHGAAPTDPHAGHNAHASAAPDLSLARTLAECGVAGNACMAHCIRLLSTGDTSMADCAKSVSDMLAICGAMERIAVTESPFRKDLAALCLRVCEACAEVCAKHADHHAECKGCKLACEASVAALRAV